MAQFSPGRFFTALAGVDPDALDEQQRAKEAHVSKMASEEMGRYATQQSIRREQQAIHDQRLINEALAGSYAQDESTGEESYDFTRAKKHLQDIGSEHLIPALGKAHAEATKNVEFRASAPFRQQARDAEAFSENMQTNKELALPALQRLVPGAQDYSVDQESGIVHVVTPKGIQQLDPQVFFDYSRTGQEKAALRAQEKEWDRKREDKPNSYKEYLAAVDELRAARQPIPDHFKSFAAWLTYEGGLKGGVIPQNEGEKMERTVTKEMMTERLKKDREVQQGVPFARQMHSVIKSGALDGDMGPGGRALYSIERLQGWANTVLGTEFQVDTNLPAREVVNKIGLKMAYSNRAAFMPGQLSNQEGQKLEDMEVSLSTTKEGALLVLENTTENAEFHKYITGKMRVFAGKTTGLMRDKTGEGIAMKMRDGTTQRFDTWEEYVHAEQRAHFNKQTDKLEKFVRDNYKITPAEFRANAAYKLRGEEPPREGDRLDPELRKKYGL